MSNRVDELDLGRNLRGIENNRNRQKKPCRRCKGLDLLKEIGLRSEAIKKTEEIRVKCTQFGDYVDEMLARGETKVTKGLLQKFVEIFEDMKKIMREEGTYAPDELPEIIKHIGHTHGGWMFIECFEHEKINGNETLKRLAMTSKK